jgi:EpsI family protein
MNPSRRRAGLVLVLMASAAATANVAKPRAKLADELPELDLERAFPPAFGDWKIDPNQPVILPSPDVQAKLDRIYNKVLSRTYVNVGTGDRIMLSVAYGGDQSDGMNIHLPEVCYPAQGFRVLSRQQATVSAGDRTIPVIRLVTKLGARVEPVTYWITVGDVVVPTRTEQKLVQIRYGLHGLIPDGMLVRVSSIDRNSDHAFGVQQAFIADLVAHIPALYMPRVLGRA